MALNKIKTGSITDDAVNSDKLAAGSVTSSELNKTAITGQTELSETANDADFAIIFDTSSSSLKKVLRSNLKQAGPTISSITPTNVNESGDANQTFTIAGSGFTAGSNARFIDNNGKVVEFDTVTRTSATAISATIAKSSLSNSGEPYDVQVTNGEGLSSLLANQVNFNASPVYTTAAGSLGTVLNGLRTGLRFTVNATDPESAGNVTFEKQSGTIPPGLALTSEGSEGGTGVISGNADAVASDTTFNFTLRAIDAASNTTSRAFSITINAPVSQSFTSSGTFSVPSGVGSIDLLVVAGGGAGQGKGGGPTGQGGGGGGGAGGLVFFPSYPVTPSGTVTVTVGDGAPGGPGNRPAGSDSSFGSPGDPGLGQGGVITAKGGGGGGGCNTSNHDGGSGGGGTGTRDACGPTLRGGGCATQPTQPGNSGAYGFGNPGGAGGTNAPSYQSGAGGGGAGARGINGYSQQPKGNGGVGKAYTIADGTTSVYYAGGGGGAAGNGAPDPSFGDGGQGGGGAGANSTQGSGGAQATANRGGGGGAGGGRAPCNGGDGGKGIVIVRY